MDVWSFTLAILTCSLLAAFYTDQAVRLVYFYFRHLSKSWRAAAKPNSFDEVVDPCVAVLHCVTRRLLWAREQGSFEPPAAEAIEPARTEDALRRAFTFGITCHQRLKTGPALDSLAIWLDDASGSWRGLYYIFFTTILQLAIAVLTGITYPMSWARTDEGQKVLLSCLVATQFSCAAWVLCSTANDGMRSPLPSPTQIVSHN